ncbi:4'-phosphopantetheinyl transferase family protein [Bacillus manliponensis]|uniref:4'-phosphopantetheinyl transferase family protein n=1 Tax=Bacillus manliponensis TaxID=574376 RepID=UPI00068CCF23|nr:4'-phosphopantetheinyl transferase superfamily protein [Bacillus manliponensis]
MLTIPKYLDNIQPISKSDVHLWLLHLDSSAYLLESHLSENELLKAKRFLDQKAKETFIICRGTLRLLLSCYLQRDPKEIELHYNSYGKPFIAPSQNKDGLNFNISHSQNMGAFAFSKDRIIGVDIEEINPTINIDELSSIIMNEIELEWFRTLQQSEKVHAFYHLWTQKEAILKAQGTGFQQPPNNFSGHLTSETVLRNMKVKNGILNSFLVKDSYSTCICTDDAVDVHTIYLPSVASLNLT